jgi:ATP-binding cassette subfamily D (ALD) protein 3
MIRRTLTPLLTPYKAAAAAGTLGGVLYIARWLGRRNTPQGPVVVKAAKVVKGKVDKVFLHRLVRLMKIVVPSWRSKEALALISLTVLLVSRTYLSIAIAGVNGHIVKAIVTRDFNMFLRRLVHLALFAVPASTVNSGLEYLSRKIALMFRIRMSKHLNGRYLKRLVYYQMCNIDNRISNPDQHLTEDVEKWATCLSNLYSNVTKPILDIVLFTRKLAEVVGYEGPLSMIAWYLLSGVVIRFITPSFGNLTAVEQGND